MNRQPTALLILALLMAVPLASPAAAEDTTPDCSVYSNAQLMSWPADNPAWEFCFRRARFSQPGPNGSGLELFDVIYNGHRVFDQFNVPIINVEYGPGGCGCFRDWVDQEVRFEANTEGGCTDGYCEVDEPTVTICDCAPDDTCDTNPGNACNVDVGSFDGVAAYAEPDRLTLTTHMAAGWYRYTQTYVFHLDGVFEPEFGFGSTPNGCTDTEHFHHAYYRMDFDIDGPADDQVTVIVAEPPAGVDTDNDGVDDNNDNCLLVENSSQADTDGDGYGNACDADLSNDNVINFVDLGILKGVMFSSDPDADFDGNGTVDFLDVALLKESFFGTPGPSGITLNEIVAENETGGLNRGIDSWRVEDLNTQRGYRVIPGPQDQRISATTFNPLPFAVGDFWVTRARSSEITDTTFQCQTNVDDYVDGEATAGEDIALWYRFGALHEGLDECYCGRVGPRLVPFGDWSAR